MRIVTAALAAAAASAASAAPAAAQDAPVAPTIQVIELASPWMPEAVRTVSAAGDTRAWAGPSDYPATAIAGRREGRVMLTVAVAADDRPSACTIVRSEALTTLERTYRTRSEPAGVDLEQAACDIVIRRGAYRHGMSADGTALAGTLPMIVNFLLTDPQGALYFSPPPMAPQVAVTRAAPRDPGALTLRGVDPAHFPQRSPRAVVSISEAGRPLGCSIATSSGTDSGDVAICRHLMGIAYAPARDQRGRRVASPRTILSLTAEPR